MKDFLFVFRADYHSMPQSTPEEMQAVTKSWMDWIGGLAAQNKLTNPGNSLRGGGKVVRPDNIITDGPFVEIKELIGGYTIVKAGSFEEAAELAKSCPILRVADGSVEIREINPM